MTIAVDGGYSAGPSTLTRGTAAAHLPAGDIGLGSITGWNSPGLPGARIPEWTREGRRGSTQSAAAAITTGRANRKPTSSHASALAPRLKEVCGNGDR